MQKTIRPSTFLQISILALLTGLFIYTTSVNLKTLTGDIQAIFTFNYILIILCNLLLLYLIYFVLQIRLIIRVSDLVISYKLKPWHIKFRKIKKTDIKSIKIMGIYFHIGTILTSNINYAIGNGYCLNIENIDGQRYLLSTGLNKSELLELLIKYGYVNRNFI
ncbi:MAG: hypothetical protein ACQPRJ_02845 [Solitalea-like symbiont of Acarus siro]